MKKEGGMRALRLHDGRESERRRDTCSNVGRASETAVSKCVNVALLLSRTGPCAHSAVALRLSGRWFGLVP